MGRHWGEDWGDDHPHRDITEAIIQAAITYEGLCVPNSYIMDIVVDDKVVVEAKAIEKSSDVNFAQLNSYLHFSSFEVGLLLNFHNWPLKDRGIKRLINTQA